LPLFRIVQHGLLNIGQHARANSVLVRLNVGAEGGVTLSLRDNGRGFDPGLAGGTGNSGHFGLRQMCERVLELGGTLDIRSAIGQGTELLITLPSAGKAAHHATG
jgi:signal transduction histidine kinase